MMKKLIFSIFSTAILFSCVNNVKENYDYKTKLFKIDTGISNVYLIKGEKNILIDTSEQGNEKQIIDKLKSYGIKPESISLIVLTHAHGDHAGGVKFFKDKYKIPVMVGKSDEKMAQNGKNDNLKPVDLFSAIVKVFIKQEYPSFKPDLIIDKTYDLQKDYGINGRVLYRPSHTEGSLVVILGEDQAIVGDLIRGGLVFNDVPTAHFFQNDKKKVDYAIKELIDNGITTFYTGHYGPLKSEDITKTFFSKEIKKKKRKVILEE